MGNLGTFLLVLIISPILLGFCYLIGLLVRQAIFKEEYKSGFGSAVVSIIFGLIVVAVLGTAFDSCNDSDDNMELWKRNSNE